MPVICREEKRMLVSGLVSVSFRDLDDDRIVELCARAGLQGIEWRGDVHQPHGDTKRAYWSPLDTSHHYFSYGDGLFAVSTIGAQIALTSPVDTKLHEGLLRPSRVSTPD